MVAVRQVIHLNYSQLRDFKKCPRLYEKKHIDGRAEEDDPKRAFIGHVLGKLVEQFYLLKWWRAPDALDWTMRQAADVLIRQVTDMDAIVWTPEEKAEWTHKIHEAIPTIIATVKREKLLSAQVFTEFETTLDYTDIVLGETVQIHGRPDIVILRQHALTALDAKAGGSLGKFTDRDQLRQYSLALWRSKTFGRIPDRAGFWWLRHDKIVWLKVSAASLTKFEGRLKETARRALAGPYEPTPGTWCRGCSFRMDCPEGRAHGMAKGSKTAIDVAGNLGTVSF